MRIFLIGMPGSGKSYWMQQLADLLHYHAVDTDRLIESREAQSVPELFAGGEHHFREKERETLLAILQQYDDKAVIATGGGAACYRNNLELMKNAGCVLYLESPVEQLIANIEQQDQSRPLLANGSRGELAEKLSGLYKKRKEIYEQAHLKIAVHTASLSTFAEALNRFLSDNTNLSL